MKTWNDLTVTEKTLVKRAVEAMLRMGETQIIFEKKDNTMRVAQATLQARIITDKIGADGYDKEVNPKTPRRESIESCRFFETTEDKNQWRSFSMDKLISIGGNKISDLIKI